MTILLRVRPNGSMFLHAIDEQEVLKILINFKGKSSTDYEGIDMYVVKKVISHIAKPLTQICNRSFETGFVPDKMKVAKVYPLFKSREKNLFTNYRPVSLLPH